MPACLHFGRLEKISNCNSSENTVHTEEIQPRSSPLQWRRLHCAYLHNSTGISLKWKIVYFKNAPLILPLCTQKNIPWTLLWCADNDKHTACECDCYWGSWTIWKQAIHLWNNAAFSKLSKFHSIPFSPPKTVREVLSRTMVQCSVLRLQLCCNYLRSSLCISIIKSLPFVFPEDVLYNNILILQYEITCTVIEDFIHISHS